VQLDTATDKPISEPADWQTPKNSIAVKISIAVSCRADLGNLRRADPLLASIERTQAQIARNQSTRRGRQARPAQHSVGSYVAPGQKVWLQKVNPIYADFDVTEEDYGRIADGEGHRAVQRVA
jgi:hypothetical protein